MAGSGLIRAVRRERMALHRAQRDGLVRRLLPGVYCEPGLVDDFGTRVRALALVDPDAILLGHAAAAAWWWPELTVPVVAATRRSSVAPVAGYAWSQRRVPIDHVIERDGIRMTDPALTVLDLVLDLGGSPIDEALRRGAVTLADLEAGLRDVPGSRGNAQRRLLLTDSRDEPWSEAERRFHRILRRAALPWPYATNHQVAIGEQHFFVDVGLPELRLAFEVDGHEHHSDMVSFVRDRRRDVSLELAGWRTHHFAATTVEDEPDWIQAAVTQLALARAAELGHPARSGAAA